MIRRLSLMMVAVVSTLACVTHSATSQTPAAAATHPAAKNYTDADVHFMAGMIGHHAQAIAMAGWAPTHGASQAVRVLCERIVVAQTDEIAMSQRWLREHGEYVPPADPRGHIMQGMDQPMLMPGMLTPQQMAQLDSARGPEFDRLFLTFMIQHHQGAITMVNELFAAGGGEEEVAYKFASDIFADQT